MSFSSEIKDELCKIKVRQKDQQLAILAGLTQTCGTLRLSRTPQIVFLSETESAIHLAASIANQLYGLDAEIGVREQEHRSIPLSFARIGGPECKALLLDTGILSRDNDGISLKKSIPDALIRSEAMRACFLRGIFLGSGSCNNPLGGYHLEVSMRTEEFADAVAAIISSFRISARTSRRKGRFLVFISGSEVSGFLSLIGATKAALKLEDVRALKDYRNYINRKSNCETANIGKTVNASFAQLRAIEILEKHMDLNDLPSPLYEAARLRLQYPDATLQELADLAEIGKSGMNHRLTRLLDMSKEYEDNQ